MYKIVDLFAGCGGLSRGFEWTDNFATQLAVEKEKHPAETFRKNIKNASGEPARVLQEGIEEIGEDTDRLWRELSKAGITAPKEVDVLVGGPPCKGFSRNGVVQYEDDEREVRFYDDPRNHLYKEFLNILGELEPKLVLIENVREFINFADGKFSRDLLKTLDELGYEASYKKLCAADYGVPQLRHRVFFIAIRKEYASSGVELSFPRRRFALKEGSQLSVFDLPEHNTVRSAIYDLPSPVYSHEESPQPYSDGGDGLSDLAELLRSESGLLHNHVGRELSEKSRKRVEAVGTGRMKDIDEELQTASFYGSAYRRMAWDEPSLTITTWVYHVGSGRFAHPEETRCVTMREAARIQTFDDDFVFPDLINPVSQMIGNAVPPLQANAFACEFEKALDAIHEYEAMEAFHDA